MEGWRFLKDSFFSVRVRWGLVIHIDKCIILSFSHVCSFTGQDLSLVVLQQLTYMTLYLLSMPRLTKHVASTNDAMMTATMSAKEQGQALRQWMLKLNK